MDTAFGRISTFVSALALVVAGLSAAPAAAEPPGVIITYEIPTAGSMPQGITAGPDGALWFVESSGNKVGRITVTGAVTEYSIPTPSSWPMDITAGPDGALWFTEGHASKVGRITPAGAITEIKLPPPDRAVNGIAAGTDGNLWIARPGPSPSITKITPQGQVTEFAVATGEPTSIATGPDGNLWFGLGLPTGIGMITPSGQVTTYTVANAAAVGPGLASAAGKMWFAQRTSPSGGGLGTITTDGTVGYLEIYSGVSVAGLTDVALGPDGNLWATVNYPTQISRVGTDGSMTAFPLPQATDYPARITAGPDGAMWFTEFGPSRIGRISTGQSPPAPTVQSVSPSSGSAAGGTSLTVTGTGFWGSPSVQIAAKACHSLVLISETTLTCSTPAGGLGSVDVTVTNPDGQSTTLAGAFTYVAPQPPPSPPPLGGNPAPNATPSPALTVQFAKKTVKAKRGDVLKLRFTASAAASLTAKLKAKRPRTKSVTAVAGVNTLVWKLPRSVKKGRYALVLLHQGQVAATMRVKVVQRTP